MFVVGIEVGWTAPTIKKLKNSTYEFTLTTDECSWIASLPEFFRMVGTVVVFLVVDIVGRKKLYLACPILFAISWFMLLVSRSVWIMYAGRSIYGIGLGINDASSLIYLAENSSPQMRGIFGSIHVSFCLSGLLTAYVLCTYLSYNAVALVNFILQFVVIACMTLLKEPAQFLILKGRFDEAEKLFFWLRASESPETIQEFDEMLAYASREKESRLSFRETMSSKANYKSLSIVIIVAALMSFTGMRTIHAYITIAFAQSTAVSAEHLTMLYGLVTLISAMISTSCIENFNRKTILVAGLLGVGVAHLGTAILYYWQQNVDQIPQFIWLIFFNIVSYNIVNALTLAPMTNVMVGELLPQSVRPLGSFLSISTGALAAFATTFAFLQVADAYGICYNFLFFSLVSFLTIAYVCFCIPEARGKSLIEVQKMLED